MSKNKKGSILAYSLIILAMMFAIVGSMSAVSVLEKKSAGSSQASVQAFQVADNGAQMAIKKINSVISSGTANKIINAFPECVATAGVAIVTTTLESDKPYTLTFKKKDGTIAATCDVVVGDIANIKSVGSYKNTTRAVDVAVGTNDPCSTGGTPVTGRAPDTNTYCAVVAKDGKTWLDRNLGSPKVATSATDSAAYGWYYQWGRFTDGHQLKTSGLLAGPSASILPGDKFLTCSSGCNGWYSGSTPSVTTLWQGVNGTNNPCPVGYRLPTGGTGGEWEALVNAEGIVSYVSAFNSTLKLTLSGKRSADGSFSFSYVDKRGMYWSSTLGVGAPNGNPYMLDFYKDAAIVFKGNATTSEFFYPGNSIRCIKD